VMAPVILWCAFNCNLCNGHKEKHNHVVSDGK
jgi:hypothetical protein